MSTLCLTGYGGRRSSTKLPHVPNSLIRGNRERDTVNCPAKGNVALRCCFASFSIMARLWKWKIIFTEDVWKAFYCFTLLNVEALPDMLQKLSLSSFTFRMILERKWIGKTQCTFHRGSLKNLTLCYRLKVLSWSYCKIVNIMRISRSLQFSTGILKLERA